ncbi:hypothetical protein RI543_000735 [Arxiozyma heterogenica]|uniref:Uncharacterized protein n=1 Tax=Arxiozyma heterogenica TaxID=278026 RepID=A0AAN7WPV4_9SACH|nr:hypothetical protein RI543_000735 [Kazachstania heterogenica]
MSQASKFIQNYCSHNLYHFQKYLKRLSLSYEVTSKISIRTVNNALKSGIYIQKKIDGSKFI